MSSSTQALAELERVQQNQPSIFWLDRQKNPLFIQSWPELALAPTAWAWMDLDIPERSNAIWKKLWDNAVTWPMSEELAYVEQSMTAWSEYPVWTSLRSMKLIRTMEKESPRDWSTLLRPQELQPQRFTFHLLHAVCLHPENFTHVKLGPIFQMVLDTPNLRQDLKEFLLVTLLNVPDEAWTSIAAGLSGVSVGNLIPKILMDNFRTAMPHRAEWLTNLEMLQEQIGETTIHRSVLASQWDILLNRALWIEQSKSYAMFDFSDETPSFF